MFDQFDTSVSSLVNKFIYMLIKYYLTFNHLIIFKLSLKGHDKLTLLFERKLDYKNLNFIYRYDGIVKTHGNCSNQDQVAVHFH